VGASQIYTILGTVDSGYEGAITNTVTVTTVQGVSDNDSVTSWVDAEPRFELSAAKTADPDPVLAGDVLTYTLYVTNTGNMPLNATITDTLPAEVFTADPTSWDVLLLAGESWSQMLGVTVQAGTTGFITNTLNVTTLEGASGAITLTTRVVGQAGVDFGPDRKARTLDATDVVFTHLLTNTGDGPDVFDLVLGSDLGWPVNLSQNPVALDAGATKPITVTVAVPVGTGGLIETTHVTATSQADSAVWAVVTDTTTVTRTRDVSIGPESSTSAEPGETVTYHYTITNTGNFTDTFQLSVNSSEGWSVSVQPLADMILGPDATHAVTVTVPVPVDAMTDTVDTTTVQVTATDTPDVTDSVTAFTTVREAPTYVVYLPLVMRVYTSNAPDLLVTDVMAEPQGAEYLISVTVENQGAQPVAYGNNFYVDLYVDRQPAPLLPGDVSWGAQGDWFDVGASHTFTGLVTLAVGAHELYAQVDTDDTVLEISNANNTYGPITVEVTSVQQLREEREQPTALPGPRPTPTARP